MAGKKFLYGLDEHVFDLPWTRPSMLQLKAWYHEMIVSFGDFRPFEFVLWGGFWSSNSSWDIDLFLVPNCVGPLEEFPDKHQADLERVYNLILTGTNLAIRKYRFLVDITFAPWQQIQTISSLYDQFSKGLIKEIVVDKRINCGFGIFKRAFKYRDGICVFDVTKNVRRIIKVRPHCFLYQKPGGPFEKQMNHISNGRIYYEPIRLRDIFD